METFINIAVIILLLVWFWAIPRLAELLAASKRPRRYFELIFWHATIVAILAVGSFHLIWLWPAFALLALFATPVVIDSFNQKPNSNTPRSN